MIATRGIRGEIPTKKPYEERCKHDKDCESQKEASKSKEKQTQVRCPSVAEWGILAKSTRCRECLLQARFIPDLDTELNRLVEFRAGFGSRDHDMCLL